MAHRNNRPFFQVRWWSVSRTNSLPYKYFWNFCTLQTTAKHSFSTVAYPCSHLEIIRLAYRTGNFFSSHSCNSTSRPCPDASAWRVNVLDISGSFRIGYEASLSFTVDSALSALTNQCTNGQLLPLTSRCTNGQLLPLTSRCTNGQLLPLTSQCTNGQLLPLTSQCTNGQLLPLTSQCTNGQLLPLTSRCTNGQLLPLTSRCTNGQLLPLTSQCTNGQLLPLTSQCSNGQLLPLTSQCTNGQLLPLTSQCTNGQLLPLTSQCTNGQLLPLTSQCTNGQLLSLTNGTFLVLLLGLALWQLSQDAQNRFILASAPGQYKLLIILSAVLPFPGWPDMRASWPTAITLSPNLDGTTNCDVTRPVWELVKTRYSSPLFTWNMTVPPRTSFCSPSLATSNNPRNDESSCGAPLISKGVASTPCFPQGAPNGLIAFCLWPLVSTAAATAGSSGPFAPGTFPMIKSHRGFCITRASSCPVKNGVLTASLAVSNSLTVPSIHTFDVHLCIPCLSRMTFSPLR